VVSEFLVAAISLIPGIEKIDHRERKRRISADGVALLKSGVSGRIVDDQDIDFVSIPKFDGNAQDYFANGLFSIVGNNENENAWLSVVGH
jgi:hypothetical protein